MDRLSAGDVFSREGGILTLSYVCSDGCKEWSLSCWMRSEVGPYYLLRRIGGKRRRLHVERGQLRQSLSESKYKWSLDVFCRLYFSGDSLPTPSREINCRMRAPGMILQVIAVQTDVDSTLRPYVGTDTSLDRDLVHPLEGPLVLACRGNVQRREAAFSSIRLTDSYAVAAAFAVSSPQGSAASPRRRRLARYATGPTG
eukprot:scaffold7381_cov310-Pinguiococcus_pyrenoidosus.AAC.2